MCHAARLPPERSPGDGETPRMKPCGTCQPHRLVPGLTWRMLRLFVASSSTPCVLQGEEPAVLVPLVHSLLCLLQPRWGRWISACSTTRRTTLCTAPSTKPRYVELTSPAGRYGDAGALPKAGGDGGLSRGSAAPSRFSSPMPAPSPAPVPWDGAVRLSPSLSLSPCRAGCSYLWLSAEHPTRCCYLLDAVTGCQFINGSFKCC